MTSYFQSIMHLESAYAGMTTHNRINNFRHNIVMITQ